MKRSPIGFGQVTVAVIGDYILDKYVFGDVKRISPEAPIPVLLQSSKAAVLGGAGNVVGNISALGATAIPIGLLSGESAGREVCAILQEMGVETSDLMLSCDWLTPIKTRFIADQQQILRLDEEEVRSPSQEEQDWLLAAAQRVDCDVAILSDYGKGTLSAQIAQSLIEIFRAREIPVLVDPKGANYAKYAGATAVTPNLKELREVSGLPLKEEAEIIQSGQALIEELNLDFVLATRSEDGLTVVQRDHAFHMPTKAREVFDVSGAGDTLIASFSVAFAAGLSLEDSAHLANVAAGIVVAKTGTATASLAELSHALEEETGDHQSRIAALQPARLLVENWRAEGWRVGFTNGCFDILHPGHVSLLEQAAAGCDKLIVGLNTDASVRRLKGETRPINDESSRAQVLAALAAVDLVVLFDEDTPLELITALRPDVLIKGSDYEEHEIVGADIVKAHGGQILRAVLVDGKSTSNIIRRIENTNLRGF